MNLKLLFSRKDYMNIMSNYYLNFMENDGGLMAVRGVPEFCPLSVGNEISSFYYRDEWSPLRSCKQWMCAVVFFQTYPVW